jgi:hypothetical protein
MRELRTPKPPETQPPRGNTTASATELRSWRPSVIAARQAVELGGKVPVWAALLALLEDFVETHDDRRAFPYRKWERTYRRSDWRCEWPGCTRRITQDHHVDYRSRGGSDDDSNQQAQCPGHHLLGEHGIYGTCRGTGPLDIIYGIGREDLRTWYKNGRRIPPPKDTC